MSNNAPKSFAQLRNVEQQEIVNVYTAYSGKLLDDFAEEEIAIRGFSLTNKGLEWLMTIRGTVGGSNKVCFMTGSNPFACLSTFIYMLEHHGIEWRDDKY